MSGLQVLGKVLGLAAVKLGVVSSLALLALLAIEPLGLPIGTTWFDGFICGYAVDALLGAAVCAMVEPNEHSSAAYIFVFRFGHILFHRSTTYFAHPSMWRKLLGTEAKEAEREV